MKVIAALFIIYALTVAGIAGIVTASYGVTLTETLAAIF